MQFLRDVAGYGDPALQFGVDNPLNGVVDTELLPPLCQQPLEVPLGVSEAVG